MMAYERLTGKSECGYNNLNACLNCDLEMDCGLCPHWGKALDRLAELEDKIEQGTMKEIHEGAVVITNEKLELGEYKGEVQVMNMTRQTYDAVLKQARKETAEKFAERLKSHPIAKTWFLYNADEKIKVVIDEIAKEISEGK
jgi:hypothetical protein